MKNLEKLLEEIRSGKSFKYLCFWGHQESEELTKSCFSQWFPAPFEIDGVSYATAEHYMMAEKARLFEDKEALEMILKCETPKDAKAYGRSVQNFDADRWNAYGFDAVVRANMAKFSQNEGMKDFLLNTGDRILVEASPVDRIWGIGLEPNNPKAQDPEQWRGKNLLGFALMEVRNKLRNNEN